MKEKLTFMTGRDGRPVAFLSGKVCLPDRKSKNRPEVGEEWLCHLTDKGRFFVALPVERIVYVNPLLKSDGENYMIDARFHCGDHTWEKTYPIDHKDVTIDSTPTYGEGKPDGTVTLFFGVKFRGEHAGTIPSDGFSLSQIREKYPAVYDQCRESLQFRLEADAEYRHKFDDILAKVADINPRPAAGEITLELIQVVIDPGGYISGSELGRPAGAKGIDYGPTVAYAIRTDQEYLLEKLEAPEDVIAAKVGMTRGEYFCEIIEAAEEENDAAIEIDRILHQWMAGEYYKVKYQIVGTICAYKGEVVPNNFKKLEHDPTWGPGYMVVRKEDVK